MRIVEESELRRLFIHPEDMEQAIKIPCTNKYVLYGKSEAEHDKRADRRARDRQVWFWMSVALANGCRPYY